MNRLSRILFVFLSVAAGACDSGDPTSPSPEALTPSLLTPAAGAALDNGCRSRANRVAWEFDWTDVRGATAYHLYVIGAAATVPAIDAANLTASSHRNESASLVADADRLGWRFKVRALVAGEWGPWTSERTFDLEPEDTDCPPPPVLLGPPGGAVLDNGCSNSGDPMTWGFDWSDVPGATAYHLFVIGPTALNPVINDAGVPQSAHVSQSTAYVVGRNTRDWRWRVRAVVDGTWGDWTPEHAFDVEPLDTDCP